MVISAETVCGDVVASTAARCRESLDRAGESLQNARDLSRSKTARNLSPQIRMALDEIGKVVGAVYTDDVLDRILAVFAWENNVVYFDPLSVVPVESRSKYWWF